MPLKKYHGSCHCKNVRYEAEIDISKGTGKCNCSFCARVRNWGTTIKSDAFTLLTDRKELGTYLFNTKTFTHYFCKNCGVRIFTQGYLEELGGDIVSVAVMTLDDLSTEELLKAPVWYSDGLHDNWTNPPSETRHL